MFALLLLSPFFVFALLCLKHMALAFQFHWALLSPGDKVLVAVSGGPDSLALLHVLWTEQEVRQLHVEAAHLDHRLRGEESAAEAEWVAEWCAERGIVCHIGKEDAAAWASEHKQSKQESARAVRYAFLERIAAAAHANKIATGHTQNDQVETVLANILRGTGLNGLRGIPERRGQIIRPMLSVSRLEIEAYCAAHGLHPRQDPSNLSSAHYTRNRLRLELLPQLRDEYNPRVDEALLRLSEIAARDSDYLSTQAAAALAEVTQDKDGFRVQLDWVALAALHPALLRSVLRLAISALRGTGEGITYEHLEQVCVVVLSSRSADFALVLPHPPCTVRITGQVLTLTLANVPVAQGDVSSPLPVPGEAILGKRGWAVTAAWEGLPNAVCLDADAVDLNSLEARNWRFGDRIDPLGMGGRHKKVSDIFTDAKVPRSERHRIPIVADTHGIVWVAGYALAERVKVTPQTRQTLFLSVRRIGAEKTSAGNDGANRE